MALLFSNLPVLVQSKILRQYVPVLYKASTLSEIPQFSWALDNCQSWLNPSETFFEFFESVLSLKPGLYLCDEERWSHAFQVSIDQQKIKFAICCLDINLYDTMSHAKEAPREVSVSLKQAAEFFNAFSKKYVHEKKISLYKLKHHGYFFVNHSTNVLRWIDGTVYRLPCYVDMFYPKHLRFELLEDRTVRIECLNSWEENLCQCENVITYLKPVSWKQRREDDRNALEFRVVEDRYVSVTCTSLTRNICHFRVDPELFNIFQEKIIY